jgi:hypothetical protein
MDSENLIGGPAQVQIDDAALAHTNGGIQLDISPKNRAVKVDQFGESEMFFRHTGDEVRLTVPFAEWIDDVLAAMYPQGNDQTAAVSGSKYMGIGRAAGFIMPAVDVKVIPFLTADAGKRWHAPKAVQIGQLQIKWAVGDDAVFNHQFACCVDEAAAAGELNGKFHLTYVAP